MGKSSKIECKNLEFLTKSQKCIFCNTSDLDEMKYGPIYSHKNIITHYYCLLLSSNMEQNGRDSEGILGFLPGDITKEVKRGMKLYCTYCRSNGATLGCAVSKCKVVFHLPCGMKNSTLHQFFGEFKSYCNKHRPVQKISERILAESSKDAMCGICYEKVVPRPIHETLWAPCCQKSAFFHRDCVQKLATSAGYFFKCPLCNNKETFQQAMKDFGIFIPEQDASWERVPQAFQDLLVRHDTCDSVSCKCPSGRKTNNSGTRWELILCKFCGSQGVHIGCGRLKWKCPEFECDTCSETPSNSQEGNWGDRHRLSGMAGTADTHPSVSADRERERDLSSCESSDDSSPVTITNRKKRVISPPSRQRIETPPLFRPSDYNRSRPTKRSTSGSVIDRSSPAILIEDSDDELEVVSDTKAGCLKTNDGSMIPVISVVPSHCVEKRLRVEGDVRIVPAEIVDITHQFTQDIKKPKRPWSPPVKEIFYSMTNPPVVSQPSTSAAYNAPSSSFYLVDQNTNSLVYRSTQPVNAMSQMQQIPTQIHPQIHPQQIPIQQLGSTTCHADAKHSNLSEYGSRGCNHICCSYFKRQTAGSKKTSRTLQHNSTGRRRGRGHTGCNYYRLNPRVMLSPLKITHYNGHLEIICSRRNFYLGPTKRENAPLPSRTMKKLKIVKAKKEKETKERQKKRKISESNSYDKSEPAKKKKKTNNKTSKPVSEATTSLTANSGWKPLGLQHFFPTLKVKWPTKDIMTQKNNATENNDKQPAYNVKEKVPPSKSNNNCRNPKDKMKKNMFFGNENFKKIDCYLLKSVHHSTLHSKLDEQQNQFDADKVGKTTTLNDLLDDIIDNILVQERTSNIIQYSPRHSVCVNEDISVDERVLPSTVTGKCHEVSLVMGSSVADETPQKRSVTSVPSNNMDFTAGTAEKLSLQNDDFNQEVDSLKQIDINLSSEKLTSTPESSIYPQLDSLPLERVFPQTKSCEIDSENVFNNQYKKSVPPKHPICVNEDISVDARALPSMATGKCHEVPLAVENLVADEIPQKEKSSVTSVSPSMTTGKCHEVTLAVENSVTDEIPQKVKGSVTSPIKQIDINVFSEKRTTMPESSIYTQQDSLPLERLMSKTTSCEVDSKSVLKNQNNKSVPQFFPKIKLSQRFQLKVTKSNSKKSKVLKKNQDDAMNVSGKVGVDMKKGNKRHVSVKFTKKYSKELSKLSVIDHYFVHIGKDSIGASKIFNSQYTKINSSNITEDKEKNQESQLLSIELENGSVTKSLKTSSPEKKPLVELQCNVIPLFNC